MRGCRSCASWRSKPTAGYPFCRCRRALDVYGIRRDRDWVFTQLRKLETLGAIEIQMAGEMPIARIARCGRDHLDERGVIEGVTRPAEAE